jgi:hypothetical protein
MCTINNPIPGDYYLQVRTNVAMPSGSPAIGTGNTAAANNNTESNTTGRGTNSFSIRAFSSTTPSANSRINVAGWERMPAFVTLPGGQNRATSPAPSFNLIRVPSAAAGKAIQFSFFDVADASGPGDVQVLRPTDATGSITTLNNAAASVVCIGTGVVGGATGTSLSRCSVPVSSGSNNGRIQTITVPIPTDYACVDTDTTGCWFKVTYDFRDPDNAALRATINDISTWSATLLGDPVRIVK